MPTASPTASLDGVASVTGGSRKRAASAAGLDDLSVQTEGAKQDNYEMLFGRVDPRHVPESGGWWKTANGTDGNF